MSDQVSRRELLGLAGAAAAGAASASLGGCAILPRGGASATTHRCDHRHCRFFRLVGKEGRCSLLARVEGGEP